MSERLFELRRRTFEGPRFRGLEFIEVEAKSIINHVPKGPMPFSWTLNPYRGCSHSCSFCFARTTHTYLDMNAGSDFDTKIVVKVNAPELLRKELRAKRWKGEPIAMGTATDPYQRAEGRYRLMPPIIEALTEARNPFSILTKGTLLVRDIERLRAASEVTDVSTAFSIGTFDDEVWRATEPGTPHPRKRMEAVARLNAAGVACGVMIAPILPHLSDDPRKLMDVVRAAVDAGATSISPILLHLRPGVREVFMDRLAAAFPELVEPYEHLYGAGAYAPKAERAAVSRRVRGLIEAAGGVRPSGRVQRFGAPAASSERRQRVEQLQLHGLIG